MNNHPKISSLRAYEILDSRGQPTVALRLEDESGHRVRTSVPSGASTGSHEALELRDGDAGRYGGRGCRTAVANINEILGPLLIGQDFASPDEFDSLLVRLDGTPDKSRYGANAILALSLGYRRLWAAASNVEPFELFDGFKSLPIPLLNVLNGGRHADNNLDIQEFMLVPWGFSTFASALEASAAVYRTLKGILSGEGKATGVGDEGGFAPELASDEEALRLLVEAIEKAGYEPGHHFYLALDVAASEFQTSEPGRYRLPKRGLDMTGDHLIDYYQALANRYPLISIEDGLGEDDVDGWLALTEKLGSLMLVGDDLFVTSSSRLLAGIKRGYANAVLIKYNQIGTIMETEKTMNLAKAHDFRRLVSHRSGETDESFMADLAVGQGAEFIKAGAPARFERLAKYNRLLEIEDEHRLPYMGTLLKP